MIKKILIIFILIAAYINFSLSANEYLSFITDKIKFNSQFENHSNFIIKNKQASFTKLNLSNIELINYESSDPESAIVDALELGTHSLLKIAAICAVITTNTILLSILTPAIVLTVLYNNSYDNKNMLETGMYVTTSIFSIITCATLIFYTGLSFYSFIPSIIGSISGTLAITALIPAIILTTLYLNDENKSDTVKSGILWSWESFGIFIIPAIISMIAGFVHAGLAYKDWRAKKKTTLDIRGNQLGICVKI